MFQNHLMRYGNYGQTQVILLNGILPVKIGNAQERKMSLAVVEGLTGGWKQRMAVRVLIIAGNI